MKYTPLPSSLFAENRRRLTERLLPNSLVIVVSNDILPTNADGTLPLRQNSDLMWLTGVDQEESILILYPDAHDQDKHKEVLFLRETNDLVAIWEGEKLTKEKAAELTGIDERRIHWTTSFENVLRVLMCQADHVYLNTNEHPRASTLDVPTRQERFNADLLRRYPLHSYQRLAREMGYLRSFKSPEELKQLQEACDITEAGFRRVAKFVKPGVGEWEVEAELLHEFVRRKSRGFAYTPIIGSGRNACVLHYIENHAVCNDGEMLLLDVAAEYGGYNADLTRTIPVNGQFTKRQRLVYDAVLRVFREACDMLRPGLLQREWNQRVGDLMEDELLELGLLKKSEIKKLKNEVMEKRAYRKYFMHGVGHHLGLDVHDHGLPTLPIAPGMVFTVEPGIYIKEEGLAVRLENDIVIGEDKNFDLMASIPIEAEAIEQLMAGKKAKR